MTANEKENKEQVDSRTALATVDARREWNNLFNVLREDDWNSKVKSLKNGGE